MVTFDNEVDPLTKHELFENGRVYILNDSNVQHQLPAPTKLRVSLFVSLLHPSRVLKLSLIFRQSAARSASLLVYYFRSKT